MPKEQPLFLRTLVEKLERALKESGRTQKALLAEANIDRETLRQWRSGKTEPGIYKLWRFAEACGVSVGSLIDEKGALVTGNSLIQFPLALELMAKIVMCSSIVGEGA